MKAYKGFDKDLKCKDFQYEVGKEFKTDEPIQLCKKGFHSCENPHEVFNYYEPGNNNRFAEVKIDGVSDEKEADSKRVSSSLKIVAEISVFNICKIAVKTFFDNFGFSKKINAANTANAGDGGAANAGDRGAANAGDRGAANAGDGGAANAGYGGAANAGYRGAASSGKNGVSICSTQGKVKGGVGAILVLVNRDDFGNNVNFKAEQVDGKKIKSDTWYKLVDGKFTEVI